MEAVLFIIFIMMFGAIVDSLPKKNRSKDDYYSERIRKTKTKQYYIYQKKNDIYVEQDVLIDLTYEQYLKTEKWKALKRERLEIDSYTCQQCGCDVYYYSSHCHHITYKNLYNENVKSDLVTVCKTCHNMVHNWHGKGAKYYPLISEYNKI